MVTRPASSPPRARFWLALACAALLCGVAAWLLSRAESAPPSDKPRPALAQASAAPLTRTVSSPIAPTRDADRPGLLALEGYVVDESGQPVPAASVSLDATPPRRAQTDREGYFSFSGLVGRTYEVGARKDEAVVGPLRVAVKRDGEPILLRLRRGAALEVLVVDARDDRPLAGAEVELLGASGQKASCDGRGIAALHGVAPGRFQLRASADRHAPERKEVFPSAKPGEIDRVRFSLLPGAEIAGTVVDPSGRPAKDASVELEVAGAALFLLPDGESARTDDGGAFRFPAVSEGSYRLRASHVDHAPAVSAPFDADGATAQPRHWLQLGQGGRVLGRVVTAAGEPAPFAEVQVVPDKAPSLEASRRLFCDERGAFEIAGLPRVAVALSAVGEAASSSHVVVDLARQEEAREVVLKLEQDGEIGGVVVGPDGAPRAEVVVRLADDPPVLGLPVPALAELTGPDGKFLLRGLKPGRHTVQAVPPGSPFPRLSASDAEQAHAEVPTGTHDVKLVLDDGSVRGRLRFADGGSPASFRVQLDDDPADRETFSGAGGAFALSRVPAGGHKLTFTGPEFFQKSLAAVVPSGGPVDLGESVVDRGRSVRGKVVDGQGAPVGGARVIAAQSFGNELDKILGNPEAYEKGQETVSGESGEFSIDGLDPDARVLLADHPAKGTSEHVALPARAGGPVTLTLRPPGSISGTLTRGGKPVQGAVTAVRQSGDDQLARFFVTSESDGSYRIDRLPAGGYRVGWGGAYRLDLLTVIVENDEKEQDLTLASGENRRLDLEIPALPTLMVQVTSGGKAIESTLFLGGPDLRAATAPELDDALSNKSVRWIGSDWWSVMSDEQPPHTAVISSVAPGAHTLCAQRGSMHSGDPALSCRPITVTATPEVQRMVIELP
ncbi:MAG TPA: carboxypeptidase regulatory-like domain-containing protein [Myxococcales bacterium]|jgi:hypothetical protein